MFIGHGYDAHRFAENRRLILCGVEIPHSLGLAGHSDADVATHAVMDALLGAACLDNIGKLFPDTDMKYKGADSIVLLKEVMSKLNEKGLKPVNIDVTIIAQEPKLAPYIPQMRNYLSEICGTEYINVKATTEEHMGFTGRCEGIAAHAVCLIELIKNNCQSS